MLDTDYVEVTAHMGARPEHAEWQGKVYKLNGSEPGYPNLAAATGYGTGPGLKGWNCRHDFYPFFPGIDERAYTDEDLRNIDPPPFEYDGKTYTAYEASQRQRQMETAMRRTKRRIMAADGAGLTDDFTVESIKLRRQREMYREFSHKAHLPTQEDRMQVLGFGHSMSSKAVWAERNSSFVIPRGLGAKTKNHEVLLPNGEYVNFTEGTYVTNIKVIAGKGRDRQIDELPSLLDRFGGNPDEWQKKKGIGYLDFNGESYRAEVHWYEEKDVGKVKFKAHARNGEWILED